MTDDRSPYDPTRMRDQPSLRNSSGTVWVLVGGLLTAVAVVILALLTSLDRPLGFAGLSAVLALYVALIAVRVTVPEGRRRLAWMATCTLAIAAASLIFISIIAATQWESLGT